jgi:hypothetical protein
MNLALDLSAQILFPEPNPPFAPELRLETQAGVSQRRTDGSYADPPVKLRSGPGGTGAGSFAGRQWVPIDPHQRRPAA